MGDNNKTLEEPVREDVLCWYRTASGYDGFNIMEERRPEAIRQALEKAGIDSGGFLLNSLALISFVIFLRGLISSL
ncbi:MAG: hypothetical protein KKE20_03760 [Nanoarchaeota archaeon]|nr:hypothetical protein [Nanoarchaeota archaeon]